jgi:hypothetical protein
MHNRKKLTRSNMVAERLICWWIGALGLARGAFCQTFVPILATPSIE